MVDAVDPHWLVLRAIVGAQESAQITAVAKINVGEETPEEWVVRAIPSSGQWQLECAESRTSFDPAFGGKVVRNDGRVETLPANYRALPFQLWPCFPDRMPVWGRKRDRWVPGEVRLKSGLAHLDLKPVQGGPPGLLVVDPTLNLIVEVSLPGKRLTIEHVNPQGPFSVQ